MSDFDRNSAAARWGRTTVDRAGTAAIDQGLRAYMLRIYNYMALALAITGFAALGTFMMAVTDDKSLAFIEKGIEPVWSVKTSGFRQSHLFNDLSPWLYLPDDLKLFSETIVFNRRESDQVLGMAVDWL